MTSGRCRTTNTGTAPRIDPCRRAVGAAAARVARPGLGRRPGGYAGHRPRPLPLVEPRLAGPAARLHPRRGCRNGPARPATALCKGLGGKEVLANTRYSADLTQITHRE